MWASSSRVDRVIRGLSNEPLPITFMSDNQQDLVTSLPLAKSNTTTTPLKLHTVYVPEWTSASVYRI